MSVETEEVAEFSRVCPGFTARNGPIARTSMRVRWKQSMASSGVQTMGSFSLKLVFRITGMPVLR